MATIVDILTSSKTLYARIGRAPRMLKVAASDKDAFIAHLRSIRLIREEGGRQDDPFAMPSEIFGMGIRYVDGMKPGQVAFADKEGNVLGFAELPMSDDPPSSILRKPWE